MLMFSAMIRFRGQRGEQYMNVVQSIETPFGVNVFGSAVVRVEPDLVSLRFRVSCVEKHPKESFQAVRDVSARVRDYLSKAKIRELASSRMTIAAEFRWVNNTNQFIGYAAHADFHLLLDQLDQFEEIVSGLVDAGVNNIQAVEFQVQRLKQVRAEARKMAVQAAHEKAMLYCTAAGVLLGTVRHIEDVNPDVMQSRGSHGEVNYEAAPDETGPIRAFAPGNITVAAAVMISYGIN
jgi:uncharacterized protein YggE